MGGAWSAEHLEEAVVKNDLESVKKALDAGVGPDSVAPKTGQTLAHLAAYMGRTQITALLLDKGAALGVRDGNGQTVGHVAVAGGHRDVMRLLLEKGVDLQIQDNSGQTVAHVAAALGNKDIMQLLVDRRINLKDKDNKGQTVAHVAAAGGHTSVMVLLLNANVDLKAMDHEGLLPLHHAVRGGHHHLAQMIWSRSWRLEPADSQLLAPLLLHTSNSCSQMLHAVKDNSAMKDREREATKAKAERERLAGNLKEAQEVVAKYQLEEERHRQVLKDSSKHTQEKDEELASLRKTHQLALKAAAKSEQNAAALCQEVERLKQELARKDAELEDLQKEKQMREQGVSAYLLQNREKLAQLMLMMQTWKPPEAVEQLKKEVSRREREVEGLRREAMAREEGLAAELKQTREELRQLAKLVETRKTAEQNRRENRRSRSRGGDSNAVTDFRHSDGRPRPVLE